MKEKLYIQTRKEFEEPRARYWSMEEEIKENQKEELKREIKKLQEEIQEKRRQIRNCKKDTFSNYCKRNNYEDWVKEIRKRHSEEFEIIENEDSKEVLNGNKFRDDEE